jgi:hypothetical protein
MWMDREQFEDLMLIDQKTFAGYARLFMDLKGIQSQGFFDWCWEQYLAGAQPSPNFTGLAVDFYSDREGTTCFPEHPVF